MKTFIILFFLTFTTTVALANQDFTWVQRFKNIVAEQGSLTHTTSLCGRDKFYMFLTLLTKMSKEVCNDSIYVHVIFGDDKIRNLDGSNTSAQYALGYCYNDFILPPEEIPPLKPYIINRYAINLVCRYGDPNISDCLALINYAFTHKEEISLNQGIVLSANFHERKLVPSISAKTIDSILAHKHEAVKSFIACKTFNLWPLEKNPIGYYYQNDKYYLYKQQPNTNAKLQVDTTGPVLFSTDNVFQISTLDTLNYLITTSDTTFYYLMLDKLKASGPCWHPKFWDYKIEETDGIRIKNDAFLIVYKSGYGLSARFIFNTKTKKLEMSVKSNARPPWSWWYRRRPYL